MGEGCARAYVGDSRDALKADPSSYLEYAARDRIDKRPQFGLVEEAIAAHPGTQVDAEGRHLANDPANVFGVEAACEINRRAALLDNGAAVAPVMGGAGLAKLLDRQIGPAGSSCLRRHRAGSR